MKKLQILIPQYKETEDIIKPHWISIVDNNVWEPGVYGWEEI